MAERDNLEREKYAAMQQRLYEQDVKAREQLRRREEEQWRRMNSRHASQLDTPLFGRPVRPNHLRSISSPAQGHTPWWSPAISDAGHESIFGGEDDRPRRRGPPRYTPENSIKVVTTDNRASSFFTVNWDTGIDAYYSLSFLGQSLVVISFAYCSQSWAPRFARHL
jgi:hypothetical protein